MIDLKRLSSPPENVTLFTERGLSGAAAQTKGGTLARCAEQIGAPSGEAHAFWVPGRIEVLGKHTDYAGGRSLLAATEQGFCFVVAPREDSRFVMHDVVSGESAELPLDPDLLPEAGEWTNYPATVVRRLARNFGLRRGADIAFGSDLPRASGMSSSSAMIVGFALALMRVNDLFVHETYRANIRSVEDLAGYLGTNENGQTFGSLEGDRGVGTFGGSEDHTAILNCVADSLSQYAYSPVVFERRVPFPDGFAFVVAYSGVVAEKTGRAMSLYNRASALAGAAAAVWRESSGADHPHLAAAIAESGVERVREGIASGTHPEFSPEELVRRFDHFVAESEEILPEAGDALADGDVSTFGAQVERSQEMGADLLANQTEETVFLARSARECGAVAASAFGAGFGGSVWSLVPAGEVPDYVGKWREGYTKAYPVPAGSAAFLVTRPGPAAFELGEARNAWQ